MNRIVALLAALSVSAAPPDDAVRTGVAAFAGGELDAADRQFRAAAERTPDPGLVAFNRAAVSARRGDWRAAEVGYQQALEDTECPPRRRAEATYNRGVCLLHRGGVAALRTAIDLFASAADQFGDDPLAADARHNRELAKLLWAQARSREKSPPNPGDLPPDLPDLPPPPAAPGSEEPGGEAVAGKGPPPAGAGRGQTGPGAEPTAGAGSLPVLNDADAVQPLTPAEAKALLARAADRLARDRKANAVLMSGPERPNVRDW